MKNLRRAFAVAGIASLGVSVLVTPGALRSAEEWYERQPGYAEYMQYSQMASALESARQRLWFDRGIDAADAQESIDEALVLYAASPAFPEDGQDLVARLEEVRDSLPDQNDLLAIEGRPAGNYTFAGQRGSLEEIRTYDLPLLQQPYGEMLNSSGASNTYLLRSVGGALPFILGLWLLLMTPMLPSGRDERTE